MQFWQRTNENSGSLHLTLRIGGYLIFHLPLFCFIFYIFLFLNSVFCLHLTLHIGGYLIFHLPLHSANKFNSQYWVQIDKTYKIPILGQYSRQNTVATLSFKIGSKLSSDLKTLYQKCHKWVVPWFWYEPFWIRWLTRSHIKATPFHDKSNFSSSLIIQF